MAQIKICAFLIISIVVICSIYWLHSAVTPALAYRAMFGTLEQIDRILAGKKREKMHHVSESTNHFDV